jgi:anti-sigma regulatory factor (Ser/Thr protein kinase)
MMSSELTIRGELSELARVNLWLEQQAQAFSIDARTLYAIDLCLEETITNTIKYGQRDDRADAPTIHLALDVWPEGARLTIIDDAALFNPLLAGPPSSPGTVEEAQVGGLGIHLMRQFASALTYSDENDRNCLVLEFRSR